jgi:hypothetical protein
MEMENKRTGLRSLRFTGRLSEISRAVIMVGIVIIPVSGRAAETSATAQGPSGGAHVLDIRKIWDVGEHNAFTDLTRFNNRFYCTLREAAAHVPKDPSGDGKIRIISSTDGEKWESAGLLAVDGVDLRDPKLSVTPDGRLMVAIGGSYYKEGKALKRRPFVSFSQRDGKGFTEPVPVQLDPAIIGEHDWLWRVTWHGDSAFGVMYQSDAKTSESLHLVRTRDGLSYDTVKSFAMDGYPNESTVRFLPNNEMLMVVRREYGDKNGRFGRSKPPYRNWEWKEINARLGGPDLLPLPDQRLVLGTRQYVPEVKTVIGELSRDGNFTKWVEFPSGGDTSYPGLLLHDGVLWVSYYSSHEGKTSIYLAKLYVPHAKGGNGIYRK